MPWPRTGPGGGLGLGTYLSGWSAALVAVGTWSLTVVAAFLLDRAGKRGPAEILLRKLTYRKTPRRSPVAPVSGHAQE